VTACFLLLGGDPGVYVRVYVAGFILLLTLTSWAAVRRSVRQVREAGTTVLLVAMTVLAALVITAASVAVVIEGFRAGVFIYLVLVPIFYLVFHFTRRTLGSPNPLREELGRREGTMRALGTPPGDRNAGQAGRGRLSSPDLVPASEAADRGVARRWAGEPAGIGQIVLALDGSEFAERALPAAEAISRLFDATLNLVSILPARGALRVLPKGRSSGDPLEAGQVETETYLGRLAERAKANGIRTATYVASGPVAQGLDMLTRELDADLLVMSTHGRSGVSRFMLGSNASATIQLATRPVLMLRPQALAAGETPQVTKVLVPLDGSGFAEQVLPWVQTFANVSNAEMILLAVPEVPEPALYGAMREAVEELRERAEANSRRYIQGVAKQLQEMGVNARPTVSGSRPATAILEVAEREDVDLIMLATHGRGGMERLVLGSVADRVVHHALCPVFLVPVHERGRK
jgi:nucleotide-binding universal stress UspA family protein